MDACALLQLPWNWIHVLLAHKRCKPIQTPAFSIPSSIPANCNSMNSNSNSADSNTMDSSFHSQSQDFWKCSEECQTLCLWQAIHLGALMWACIWAQMCKRSLPSGIFSWDQVCSAASAAYPTTPPQKKKKQKKLTSNNAYTQSIGNSVPASW